MICYVNGALRAVCHAIYDPCVGSDLHILPRSEPFPAHGIELFPSPDWISPEDFMNL
jgi:hypothetical protein